MAVLDEEAAGGGGDATTGEVVEGCLLPAIRCLLSLYAGGDGAEVVALVTGAAGVEDIVVVGVVAVGEMDDGDEVAVVEVGVGTEGLGGVGDIVGVGVAGGDGEAVAGAVLVVGAADDAVVAEGFLEVLGGAFLFFKSVLEVTVADGDAVLYEIAGEIDVGSGLEEIAVDAAGDAGTYLAVGFLDGLDVDFGIGGIEGHFVDGVGVGLCLGYLCGLDDGCLLGEYAAVVHNGGVVGVAEEEVCEVVVGGDGEAVGLESGMVGDIEEGLAGGSVGFYGSVEEVYHKGAVDAVL